jgi:ABC-type proline/glycine betaine transport system ATPase subunit
MISHDFARALGLADRIAILSHGKIAHTEAADRLNIVTLNQLYSDVTGMAGPR